MNNWIIPFKGKNESQVSDINFLWRKEKVFIMDNHLAAAWCWAQCIDVNQSHTLLHLDAHYDAADLWDEEEDALPKSIKSLSIDDYLALTYDGSSSDSPSKLFRWDNFITSFVLVYPNAIAKFIWTTHDEGDKPKWTNVCHVHVDDPYKFLKELVWNLSSPNSILDIDIDYFFGFIERGDQGTCCSIFADNFLREIGYSIKACLEKDTLKAVTIALSPECCGGWENAKHLCEVMCEAIGLEFRLQEATR